MIPMGQEFQSSLTGWYWLKISHEAAVKILARAAVSASKVPHSHAWLSVGEPYHVNFCM